LAEFLEDEDIDRLAATSTTMRRKMDDESIWHGRFRSNMRDSLHDDSSDILHTADDWANYVVWQRSHLLFGDNSLFGRNRTKFRIDPHIAGIKKSVITDNCIFVLDYAGKVHKWDEDDEWKLNVLTNVVDIITDASDLGRNRTSLFVLSQSEKLFEARPKLGEFYRYKKDGIKTRDFERKLKHWHRNGAPRSGDRVDVFRIETSLRRVFKMTFQQAHRFISLQVSNRDYLKGDNVVPDSRGRHINELQLLTVKGRVWSLTVNEPELIANGGGAQVALRNITSRFDLKGDDDEELHVEKTFNGKFVSAMICTKGNLHVFSDQDERLREMFPLRTLLTTTMGADQETKKLSTSISIGAKIRDVSISSTHMLILDEFGRLWSVGMNRSGQLGLGHKIDQSNPKLVPVAGGVLRVISICASASCSIVLCEMGNGGVKAYFAGKMPGASVIGFPLMCDSELDEEMEPYGYRSSAIVTRFREVDVKLTAQTDSVSLTTQQILFASRHAMNKKSPFKKLPSDWSIVNVQPCRTCRTMEPSWEKHNDNEFYNYVSDKTIRWLNERISRCECAIGNHIYRSILMERLTIARHYQQQQMEMDEIGYYQEVGGFPNPDSNDLDEIIEALALAHSINNQLPPFSALY